MKRPKYIENENLPLPFLFREHPQFYIYNYEKEGNNYRLYYQVDGRGLSVYLEDNEKFKKFPVCFEVESGGWYGAKGRWTPIERYRGSIICENVSSFEQVSVHGKDFSFKATKPFLSSIRTLLIESEKIGTIKLKCKRIVPQGLDILLYNKQHNQWLLRSYVIENLASYLDEIK